MGPRIPTVIAVCILMVFLVGIAALSGILEIIWRTIVIIVAVEVVVFFMPNYFTFFGLKTLKKRNGGKLPEAIITVSDRITCRSGEEEITYEFADLVGAVPLKYSYKLRFTERRSLLIDPDAFTKGNLEEFKQFLRKKRPDLKIPD